MGLREINRKTSYEDAVSYVIWTDAAVHARAKEGDKEMGALAEVTRGLLQVIDQQAPERRERVSSALHAQVEGQQALAQLDKVVPRFHNRLLGICALDRQDERFRRFFPATLSSTRNAKLADRVEQLRRIVAQLGDPTTPAELRKEFDKPLGIALKTATAALARREAADRIEAESLRAFARWREQANQTLFGLDGRLRHIAATRGLGKAWVDSFFRPGKVRRSAATVTPPIGPAVGEAAPVGGHPAAIVVGGAQAAA